MKQINYTGSSKLISRIVSLLNRKAPLPLDGDGNPDWGTNGQVLSTDGAGNTAWVNQGGGGSGGHTIEKADGTDMTARALLQFIGAYLQDDAGNDRTIANIVRKKTQAEVSAMSAAEKEGLIYVTDAAGQLTASEVALAAIAGMSATTVQSGVAELQSDKVEKSGDTMTSHLTIQRAGEAYVNVKNTNTGCIAYLDSDTNGDHGVWSHGYWNGSSYTASGRWILRRTTDGRAAIDVATVIGKNNTTDTPLVVNRSNSGTVWIDFQNGGSEIGAFGVSAAKKPLFYDTSTHVLSMRTVTTLVDETANIAASGNKTYATLTASALSVYDEIWIYAEYGNTASTGSATKAQIAAAASYSSGGVTGATIQFFGYALELSGTMSITQAFGIKPRSTGLQVFNNSVSSTIGRLLIEGITY